MKQFYLVWKLFFKNAFSFGRKNDQKMKKSTLALIVIGLAFTYLIIVGSLVAGVAIAAPTIKEKGLLNEFIVLCYAIGGVVVLFFGAIQLLNALYFSKDNEFFLSLPVKHSTVFLAKFLYVYVIELILVVIFLVPVLLTVAIAAKMSAFFYFMILVGAIIAPAFPLMFAAILMIPLMYVVTFFKNRRAFSSIFAVVFFGVAYGVYFFFIFSNNADGEGTVDFAQVLENLKAPLITMSHILYPYLALARLSTLSQVFGQSIGVSALINFIIFLVSCGALLALAFLISNRIYKIGAASQLESQKKKATGKESYIANSQLKALMKKEWRETIRTPSFAFQCFAGIVLAPVLIVMICVNLRGALVLEVEEFQFNFNAVLWYACLGIVIMMGVGMNMFASTAITREGKNFYFSKMMPVAYATQIKSKLVLSTIISLVAAFPSLIIMTITLKEYVLLIPSLIFTAIYSFGFNCLAIYVDLTKPKLDWTTPQQAMKQNFRAAIPYVINSLVSGGVFILMPIICTVFLTPLVGGLIIWIFNFMFAILASIIFWSILSGHTDKCYERLSV